MGAASCGGPVVEEEAVETDGRLAEVTVTSSAEKPDEVPLWKVEAEAALAAGEAAALAVAEAAAAAEVQAAAAAAAAAEEAKAEVAAADAAKKAKAKAKVKAKAKAKVKAAPVNETPEDAAATSKEPEKPKPKRTGFGKQELTMAEARDALDKATELFDKPENTKKLKDAVKDVKKRVKDKSAQQMAIISTIVPLASGMFGELLLEYGFKKDDAMEAMMQIFDKAEKDKSGDMMAKFERVKGIIGGQI